MTRWERGLNFLCSAKRRENWNAVEGQWLWIYKVTLVGCVPFHSRQRLHLGLGQEAPYCMNDHDNECWYKNGAGCPIASCFLANWLQEKKERGKKKTPNLHYLLDCVSAAGLNATARLSQVNPNVQKISPHWLVCPFSSFSFSFPELLDLIWSVILDSPGPRLPHHVPVRENRSNHSTASAGSVLTQSPGEEL